MTGAERRALQDEYIEWLILDRRTRKVHRLPDTETEFAELKEVSTRTLRRWRDEDEKFQKRLAKRRDETGMRNLTNSTVSPAVGASRASTDRRTQHRPPAPAGLQDDPALRDPDVSEGELEYRRAKTVLVELAGQGDKQALDLFFKHYGKPFIEAEQAARESSFADLSDDELVDEVLSTLGPDAVAGWMAKETMDG